MAQCLYSGRKSGLNVRTLFLLRGLEQGVQLQDWWSGVIPRQTWHIGLKVLSRASEAIPINVRPTEIF